MQAALGPEGPQLALLQFLKVRDVACLSQAGRAWAFGDRPWASLLLRDLCEEAPDGMAPKTQYRCVQQWRKDAELSVYDIAKLPDADATLAYMARKSYYPVKEEEPTEEELEDPYWEPERKDDAEVMNAACQRGLLATLKALVAKGFDMNKARSGQTPLHLACSAGHLDVVKLLLAEGVEVNGASMGSRSPLLAAIYSGRSDVARHLISVPGVDRLATTHNGETALHIACEKGLLDMVRLLIEDVGMDASATNNFRQTPLYEASYRGHTEVVRYLLTVEGVDVNFPSQHGTTAHHIAGRYAEVHKGKYLEVMALLEAAEGFVRTEDTSARGRGGRGRGRGRAHPQGEAGGQ